MKMSKLETLKNISALVPLVALVGALGFFVWKVSVGYSVINLSLSLETKRIASNTAGKDLLWTRLIFTKGDRARLQLTQAKLDVRPIGGAPIDSQSHVLDIAPEPLGKSAPPWSETVDGSLWLSPGESTHFEYCFVVPSGGVLEIQAEVQGDAKTHGGWRVTAVSLPIYNSSVSPAVRGQ
jgi:hypothetical protein